MQETYEEFIQNILDTRGRFNCGNEYHERHHIVPKCMGGSNDEENLIDLFANEHFIAHKLLALENPENYKLVYAWSCMAFAKRDDIPRYELTPEEYEEARITFSKAATGRPMSEEAKQKMRDNHADMSGNKNPFYGKHHTKNTKNKLSEIRTGKYIGNKSPKYGTHPSEETKKKMSISKTGMKASNKTKKKMSEQRKGFKNSAATVPIYCIQMDEIFWGAMEAKNKYGFNDNAIRNSIRDERIHAGKDPFTDTPLNWKYVYDKIKQDGSIIQGAITLGYITEERVNEYLNNLKNKGD